MAETEGKIWKGVASEPDWAKDNISQNECAVAYFGGQTALYIPKNWFIKLGPDAEQIITHWAAEVYSIQDPDSVLSTAICNESFLVELPPQMDWSGKQHRPFDKVTELIERIREAIR